MFPFPLTPITVPLLGGVCVWGGGGGGSVTSHRLAAAARESHGTHVLRVHLLVVVRGGVGARARAGERESARAGERERARAGERERARAGERETERAGETVRESHKQSDPGPGETGTCTLTTKTACSPTKKTAYTPTKKKPWGLEGQGHTRPRSTADSH
jgi:hypothetical protein